jgi:WXG100 family type VII secretion target
MRLTIVMSAPIVQVRYETLERVSTSFQDQCDAMQRVHTTVSAKVARLKAGGWLAEGASTFYREMDNDVLPAVNRLCQALGQASTTMREIALLLQQAEEEAADHLRTGNGADGGPPSQEPVYKTENAPSYKLVSDTWEQQGGTGGAQTGGTYPNPRDFVNQYMNFDFWGGLGSGQWSDIDETQFANDLVSRYLSGNPPSAQDIAFVHAVLREIGYYNRSEAVTAVYQLLMANGNTAWLANGGRDVRALAMDMIDYMQTPQGSISGGYGFGSESIPPPAAAYAARDALIRTAFPEIATLEGAPWLSGPFAAQFQASAGAVNGAFQPLSGRGGDVVFDRFETTVSLPPGVNVQQYFQGILTGSPSSVGGWAFNNITQFSPHPNSQPFGPPIAGNVGLGSVFNIDFIQAGGFTTGFVDGGVMLVDAQMGANGGYFTYQAMTVDGRVLPEFGARQFGYIIEGTDANGNQIVTIYTQAASRPSDPLTEVGGDFFQPISWEQWMADVGSDITQNGQAGTIIGTDSFSTGSTD